MPHHPADHSHPHLSLMKEDVSYERKKKRGIGGRPHRGGRDAFAPILNAETARVLEEQNKKPALKGIKPHLVFKIPVARDTDSNTLVERLEELGLTIVSIEFDKAIVVFRDSVDLIEFQRAIEKYHSGPKKGINPNTGLPFKSTKYDILEIIEPEKMRLWCEQDRIGPVLSEKIGMQGDHIDTAATYVVEVELWHPGGSDSAKSVLNELKQFIAARKSVSNVDTLCDWFIGENMILAKLRVNGTTLKDLLKVDVVAEIDMPPTPIFDHMKLYTLTTRDFPKPPKPPEDGPRLCILDTGIAANHPLLAQNVGHEEAILTNTDSPSDMNGHGTMVGGIAVFGNIRGCISKGIFASNITLFSARVLNDRNTFDDEKLIYTQMREAIEVFIAPPHNCRVFNISIGSHLPAFEEGRHKQTIWAATLDMLALEYDILIVVSAGNQGHAYATNAIEAEKVLQNYPAFLFEDGSSISDPATAAIALTVGSLARHDEPALRKDESKDDIIKPIARKNQPSPMTRVGPGLNGAIKPEFVHYGGNLVFSGFGQQRKITKESGTSIISFSHEPTKRLFVFDNGTSFAAPQVSRLASLLEDDLRRKLQNDPHPNLIRAVLANSADIPDEVHALFENGSGIHQVRKACGYGLPDEDYALSSWDRRVTLIADSVLTLDWFHIYSVPIPDVFRETMGNRMISVSLAYDPPVRRHRYDYLGVEMNILLIRGKTLDEVAGALKRLPAGEDAEEIIAAPYKIDLEPKSSCRAGKYHRKKSTLQHCRIVMKKREGKRSYGDEYYLVVRAERKWAPPEIESQRYAVAVTLSVDNNQLYNQVELRIQQRLRARARTRA